MIASGASVLANVAEAWCCKRQCCKYEGEHKERLNRKRWGQKECSLCEAKARSNAAAVG